jgi:LPXTG-site transpeptidase (sortase) family protein
MSGTNSKIKTYATRIAVLAILFLAAFFAGFYLINLNIKPTPVVLTEPSPIQATDINTELKKRLGSTDISMESYNDWASRYDLYVKNRGLDADPDNDGLPNYLEYVHGTNPLKADTDGDGFSDKQEIANGFDPDAPGDAKPMVFMHIDKIKVDAPMVWSQSEDDQKMLKELERGISHFYKTAAPGQNGNAVISGHSSNYIWAKGDYNHIFENLNNLEKGDTVTVRTIQQNGRILTFHYQVTEKFIAAADDQRIFEDAADPTLTLSTCWPIGTNLKRAVIKAQIMK